MTETPLALDSPGPRFNLPEYSVSEISAAVKRSLEQDFSHVRVRGEISGFKRHSSGHCYLALKDSDAVLDGVIWRPTAQRLAVKPEDGMEVVCTGRITTYPGRSKYQLVIDSIELAGIGALLKMLEERRMKLAEEGLFDEARKKKLPFLPEVIGIVTSPTGAVIRDILHRLNDRFPRRVLLWPVAVQGQGAAEQIASAITGFNGLSLGSAVPRPDVLIIARGGGSLEDLMAFNEEVVVRAAASSIIPLISAVGHETDTTLIDYASDRRAPTPSAAAEMAVPVRFDLVAEVSAKAGRLVVGFGRKMEERRLRVEGLARGLPDPHSLLETATQRLDDRAERLNLGLRQFVRLKRERLSSSGDRMRGELLNARLVRMREVFAVLPERMTGAIRRSLEREDQRLKSLAGRLESHRQAWQNVLARGYALVRGADDTLIMSASAVTPGAALMLEFHDGRLGVTADGAPRKKPRRTKHGPGGQGSLL